MSRLPPLQKAACLPAGRPSRTSEQEIRWLLWIIIQFLRLWCNIVHRNGRLLVWARLPHVSGRFNYQHVVSDVYISCHLNNHNMYYLNEVKQSIQLQERWNWCVYSRFYNVCLHPPTVKLAQVALCQYWSKIPLCALFQSDFIGGWFESFKSYVILSIFQHLSGNRQR